MHSPGILCLRDPETEPSDDILKLVLDKSYSAYEALLGSLSAWEIEQAWQWYTPHKAWFAKGQHFWTTSRGTKKEKNLYWLHVYEGFFCLAIWFKEKNRDLLIEANVTETTRQLIKNAETAGKIPTFPVVFTIYESEILKDVAIILEMKKQLEK